MAYKSDYAEAFNNRGNTLRELQRLEDALASYDKALADHAEALCDRGKALIKRPVDELASYDKALALKPDHAEALCDRGKALRELCRRRSEKRTLRCFGKTVASHFSGPTRETLAIRLHC
jgi:tetratricopeptide (TPR) repeat protein